jgi:hypothetical protein
VYDHFVGRDFALPLDTPSNTMCGGHYLVVIYYTPSPNHTIALAMFAACVFYTA